ncbi:REP-associated tyrosine transposase [Skermanella pratensis]|uniref:REP-associated tyrosine transposase n=1 Tax=Skermanella pratensis TaxID=2233999 RepID=UPI0017886E01|nr:transposase [Skermanella pratensis]
MEYRRDRTPGGTYFFTVVTYGRPLFEDPAAVELLRGAFRIVMSHRPFQIGASVVLPDHLHMIWTLPEGDSDYSMRWNAIKGRFTALLPSHLRPDPSKARTRRDEQAVWQRRFWEHRVRDEADYERCVAYINGNPVKHGLVSAPADWPHSSIHRRPTS